MTHFYFHFLLDACSLTHDWGGQENWYCQIGVCTAYALSRVAQLDHITRGFQLLSSHHLLPLLKFVQFIILFFIGIHSALKPTDITILQYRELTAKATNISPIQICNNQPSMRPDDQANTFSASFSDFCSVEQRLKGVKEQVLLRENSRLRREHSEISEKYIKLCDDISKMQTKVIEKERKITELDLFYKRQIQELKKELQNKTTQLSKLQKTKDRNSQKNLSRDSETEQNKSVILQQVQTQNGWLYHLLETAIKLFQPYARRTDNMEIVTRIAALRKDLGEKANMSSTLQRSNSLLQDFGTRQIDGEGEIEKGLAALKNKRNQLRKMPISFDYDLEVQSKDLQVLLASLEIHGRMIPPWIDADKF